MRIAYIARVDAESKGVQNKILSQIRAWSKMGLNTFLYVIGPEDKRSHWHDSSIDNLQVEYFVENYRAPLAKRYLQRSQSYAEILSDLLRKQPDLVYLRYEYCVPPLYGLIKKFQTVVEINTNDRVEFFIYSKLYGIYNYLTRHLILSNASGFILVTNELKAVIPKNKPSRVIANGIDLSLFPIASTQNNQFPRLIFSGTNFSPRNTNPYPWHGVDKIFYLASQLPECDFTIVGLSSPVSETLPPNVTVNGLLTGKSYDVLFDGIDVAISTLALHRKKMNEACPLKTREYLARGLPVIIGYKDTDLVDGLPFVLRIPNEENNIVKSVAQIREFAYSMRGQRVPRELIAHLDVSVKEKERVAFFASIVATSRNV